MAEGSRVPCPLGLIDLAPTLCDYLGVRCPESFAGASLLADAPPGRYVVSEHFPSGHERRAIRNGRFKLIHRPDAEEPTYELYDLEGDPDETRNRTISTSLRRSSGGYGGRLFGIVNPSFPSVEVSTKPGRFRREAWLPLMGARGAR